jgi:N-terminal acetyltransferase B complex non-catalytic subunit
MSAAIDRQIKPIYDSLDTGSPKSAIVTCNKLLKKYPKNELIKALKALALIRSGKVEECLVLCDDVLSQKPTDDAVLSAMSHVLRGLGRHQDLMSMFEDAYKQQPANEELGQQAFFANARAGHWKNAQLTATKLFKQFQSERYLYWSIMSAVLQANEPATAPAMRTVLYKLALRLISSSTTPTTASTDRFHLHVYILRELDIDEACKLLESEEAKTIYGNNLAVDELRRDIWTKKGMFKQDGDLARTRITEKNDRNWLEFLSVLNTAFAPVTSTSEVTEEAKNECRANIEEAATLFEMIKESDGRKDRSGALGLIELEWRARQHGLSQDPSRLLSLMEEYVRQVGAKPVCFEDLTKYLDLEGDELKRWTAFLEERASEVETLSELTRYINVQKLLRHNLSSDEITTETELGHAQHLTEQYFNALKLVDKLNEGELHPADDLAIIAANAFVSAHTLSGNVDHLYRATALLEYALTKSKHAYQIRLMLVQIYRVLAAPSQALEHYRALRVKQIQNDTLSHYILTRCSTFSLGGTGDLTFATECLEASNIYINNSHETADYTARAFVLEKYSQIPEFVEFEDKLDCSLHRDIIKIEHMRMRYGHEIMVSEVVDMELIELKSVLERYHHDNRDFGVIPSYQPKSQPTFFQQTRLFSADQERNWLRTFLKIYVNLLSQASDLDETVEEKLLIGDRPKQNCNTTDRPSLKNFTSEENAELTPDEAALRDFGTALADWTLPYHDYARPHPSVVLADAAKQAALKGGQPLKGIEIPPNGAANGNIKKEEDPPAVTTAPEILTTFFDNMKARMVTAVESRSRTQALHLATLTQEGLLFIIITSLRWKSASVVKVNKFGSLLQQLKTIRTHAISVLKGMVADLQKLADDENVAQRKLIQESCTSLPIDHDFILDVAKNLTDSRKKVLEGVSKGITRVCTTYSTFQ